MPCLNLPPVYPSDNAFSNQETSGGFFLPRSVKCLSRPSLLRCCLASLSCYFCSAILQHAAGQSLFCTTSAQTPFFNSQILALQHGDAYLRSPSPSFPKRGFLSFAWTAPFLLLHAFSVLNLTCAADILAPLVLCPVVFSPAPLFTGRPLLFLFRIVRPGFSVRHGYRLSSPLAH